MRALKVLPIVGASLFVAGAAVCGCAFTMVGFDYTYFNTVNYVTNTYEVEEDFSDISIRCDTGDITFALSEDDTCTVVCRENEKAPSSILVADDTLFIEKKSSLFSHIGISIGDSPSILIRLPREDYGTLTIDSDIGDIIIPENISFEDKHIKIDIGHVRHTSPAVRGDD